MPLDDVTVMQRVQAGQHELFDVLVLRYREELLRVACSKIGDRALAEDIVQETFLAAFAARDTYNSDYSFRTWLWTILINLCRRYWKRRAGKPQEVTSAKLTSGEPQSVTGTVDTESGLTRVLAIEQREQLDTLLRELPQVQADALRLRFYGGLKFAEIARAMNSSISAAKVRVRNGLAKLATRLRELEGESP